MLANVIEIKDIYEEIGRMPGIKINALSFKWGALP